MKNTLITELENRIKSINNEVDKIEKIHQRQELEMTDLNSIKEKCNSIDKKYERILKITEGLAKKYNSAKDSLADLDFKLGVSDDEILTLKHKWAETEMRLFHQDNRLDSIDSRTLMMNIMYDNLDKCVKEIQDNRQERIFIVETLKEHGTKLENLEKSIIKPRAPKRLVNSS